MPLRFRTELGMTFVITKGLGKCLFVYREDAFSALEKQMMEQPPLDMNAIRLQRWFSAEAVDTQSDSQGRVAIPSNLREFAGIGDEVTIVGTGPRIEIWSRTGWDAFNASVTEMEVSQSAVEIGLARA